MQSVAIGIAQPLIRFTPDGVARAVIITEIRDRLREYLDPATGGRQGIGVWIISKIAEHDDRVGGIVDLEPAIFDEGVIVGNRDPIGFGLLPRLIVNPALPVERIPPFGERLFATHFA